MDTKITFNDIKNIAKGKTSNIDLNKAALKAGTSISDAANNINAKAAEVKDAAMAKKEDIENKLTELDRMLQQSITDYNDAFTLMNDKGVQLYVERCRAVDTIGFVENLVNSIANKPKSFEADFDEISKDKLIFTESCEFASREVAIAREAAGSAGAGLAAGASVAFMGPSAAMWIATTFGTASTGTAISTLSGAAASNAALAWLGGGALAAGGNGMAAGSAFLAMAGPIGWTIAGATLMSSILLFTSKKTKLNKEKNEEIEVLKRNIESVKEMDYKIKTLLDKTISARNGLYLCLNDCMSFYGKDYSGLDGVQKNMLGSMVIAAKAVTALMAQTVE